MHRFAPLFLLPWINSSAGAEQEIGDSSKNIQPLQYFRVIVNFLVRYNSQFNFDFQQVERYIELFYVHFFNVKIALFYTFFTHSRG